MKLENSIKKMILSSLEQLDCAFDNHELAFLALTSKIELPIRDRLSYILYKKCVMEKLLVIREWKKTDIAILDNGTPKALIELTAMFSYDAVVANLREKYAEKMLSDENKATKLANQDTSIYTVLFATHPLDLIPDSAKETSTYNKHINKALKKYGNAGKIAKEARHKMTEIFVNRNVVVNGKLLKGGEAFGVNVDILYWIIEGRMVKSI